MIDAFVLKAEPSAVIAQFGTDPTHAPPATALTHPRDEGLVVRQEEGIRLLQKMTWGFPEDTSGGSPGHTVSPLPVIADVRQPYWYGLVSKPPSRCLVPASAFSDSAGGSDTMARSWFRLRGQPILAFAALWRGSYEWGPAFSFVMTEALLPGGSGAPAPLIILPHEYDTWLFGTHEDALSLLNRPLALNALQMTRRVPVR